MTSPYSPEVRKRLEALAARCEQIAADHASPFKDGHVFDSETLAAIQWYKQEAADLSAALAHIETLEGAQQFQARVAPWMTETFGAEISADKVERGDRLLEETFELLQSIGYDRGRVAMLAAYVWDRPAGEPSQEVGGVMVCLAALCLAAGLDMHRDGETELARIWTKVEAIRAKQKTKPRGSPLPVPARALNGASHDQG